MSGYGYSPWGLVLQQQQQQQLAQQQNGYMSPNGYGYGSPGSRGSGMGYQINPPQTQYAGDPSSMYAAMASVINNQNTNQAQYDTAYGNAIWNRNNLLDQLRNQTQITGMNNETQRYGYDSALQGQLGVADRNLQGQLGVADRNMQTQLGTAGMALQGQLGAANIGANAQNYGNMLQAQTARSGQQNAYDIANLQNQGGITQAQIQANAQMLPANLRQQRFESVLPLFQSLLGGPTTGSGGTTPVATPAPAPAPAPAPSGMSAPGVPFHQQSPQQMALMNQISANGRGNDPNLAGSQAWYAQQAQGAANDRVRRAAAAPVLAQQARTAQTPTVTAAGGRTNGAGVQGPQGATAAFRNQLSQALSGSPQQSQAGQPPRPMANTGGMNTGGMNTGGGAGNPTYTPPDKQKAYASSSFQGPAMNTGGGAGNPMYSGGGSQYGSAGTGPVAGGLPGGTGGPGAPLPDSFYGSAGTGPVSGGLPMGMSGPGGPAGGSPSASPFGSSQAPVSASPLSGGLPSGSDRGDLHSRMLADRAAAQSAAAASDSVAAAAPLAATSPAAGGGAASPASPDGATGGNAAPANTGLMGLLGGSFSSSGGTAGGDQPPITIAPPSTPQMWQQRVNAQVGSNAAQMAQQNQDLMRSSAARYGTNSRATQSMMQQNNARLMGLNQQARTQIPMQGMQQYSDYLLNAQRAQEEQYANRQREALQRQQVSVGSIAPLLQALSSFSG